MKPPEEGDGLENSGPTEGNLTAAETPSEQIDQDAGIEPDTFEVPAPQKDIVERLAPFVQPGRADEAALVVQSMLFKQRHSGPIPSAREFRGYEAALPGAGDRILSMAEREQGHRQDIERLAVIGEINTQRLGQWLAMVALCLMLLVVGLFAWLGHDKAGASLGGIVIIGVVALFLGQKYIPQAKKDGANEE